MVKLFATTCGNTAPDGWVVYRLGQIPNSTLVQSVEGCDIIVFVWTWQHNYIADPATIERIIASGKPVVVMDYIEGADTGSLLTSTENWISALKAYEPCTALKPSVKVYFKREYQGDRLPPAPFPVVATDFITDYYPGYDQAQTRAEFESRPIDLFYFWGYSSIDRVFLHAELIKFFHHPFAMCCSLEEIEYALKAGYTGIKAFLFIPPARRSPMDQVLKYQGMSKLSLNLRGCGWKCFRHAESPYNSVMAMQQCPMEFVYPWQDEVNCAVMPNLPRMAPDRHWLDYAASLSKLSSLLRQDLYPIYLAGVENAQRYIASRYIQSHWIPTMKKHGVWP